MGKAEWGGNPVCWWLGLYFGFVYCLDETSCPVLCYWWLGDPRAFPLCEFSLFDTLYGYFSREGTGDPLQYSCLENPMDGGAWWAAVHGVAKSQTWLSHFTFTFMHWKRKWQPTPVFLPRDRGAWWATVHGVAQSRTLLKRLSSSSSSPSLFQESVFFQDRLSP